MKLIIATLLVVSVVTVASVARADRFKSVGDCKTYVAPSSTCDDCCEQFGLVGVQRSVIHNCKCITSEEAKRKQAKEDAEWEKKKAEPRFKSVGDCKTYIAPSSTCDDCCETFGLIGVQRSIIHNCKCIKQSR